MRSEVATESGPMGGERHHGYNFEEKSCVWKHDVTYNVEVQRSKIYRFSTLVRLQHKVLYRIAEKSASQAGEIV